MKISNLDSLIQQALREDAAGQDVTTHAIVGPGVQTRGFIMAKENFILCGLFIVVRVFNLLDKKVKVTLLAKEGQQVCKGQKLVELTGPARSILAGERVALNFMQHVSGVATETNKYAQKLKGLPVRLLDTRKTTPNFRELERYAVRVGGGHNHRFDLKSAAMAKENHLALAGSVSNVIAKLKKLSKRLPVIIEVDNIRELREAIAAGAKYIQLDNMNLRQIKRAVSIVDGSCQLEATGGVRLRNIRAIAKAGVDFVSVGRMTHSAIAVDVSFRLVV